jgi:3-methyladenine DNA glycosylase/8-oxoguanine DNA glycosylase
MRTLIQLPLPADFHYEHTIYSHGWCALSPFTLQPSSLTLERPLRLNNGRIASLRCLPSGRRSVAFMLLGSGAAFASRLIENAQAQITAMFRLDQDLRPFHRLVAKTPRFSWIARSKAGRLLRCPTFFEDVIKMVLTTNCSWSLTEHMCRRLVEQLGESDGNGNHCFPQAEAILQAGEQQLREAMRLGYRAPYVLALARRAAHDGYDFEAFRSSTAPARELYEELLRLEGVGPYAAGNLLKLLGRFDYLGLDSWCRTAFARKYAEGVTVHDKDIENVYAEFEQWKGLIMWLDLTQHWYTDKFPFHATS